MPDYRLDLRGLRPGAAAEGQGIVLESGLWAPGNVVRGLTSTDDSVNIDDTDPLHPDLSVVGGGGGGTAESFSDVIADLVSSGMLVHYWALDEDTGATAVDGPGTLDLALTGSYSWITSPLGGGLSLAGGYGVSTGLGSLGTGTANRCMFVIFRDSVSLTTNGHLMGYGGTLSTNNAGIEINYSSQRPNIGRFHAANLNSRGGWFNASTIPDLHNHHATGKWHFAALSYFTTPDTSFSRFFLDGIASGDSTTVTVSNTGNFRLGDNPGASAPLACDIACAGAFNTDPGLGVLSRMYAAFVRALP